MPGNEVEDGFCYLFELQNLPRGQTVTGAADAFRGQVINQDIAQIGAPSNFNLKNFNAQQLDSLSRQSAESLRLLPTEAQFSPGSEFSGNIYVNHPVTQNVFPLANRHFQGMQNQSGLLWESPGYNQDNLISGGYSVFKFQQENDSVGSPTLTTNSERSEITEASTDFCFPIRRQENFTFQRHVFPQYSSMQQSGYDEMQLLQQQLMLKQLQDLQRQQQLQQQNCLNPFSTFHKQANSGQFPALVDGMPLSDASQGYINWVERGASPTQQGTLNRAMFSMGLGSQQLDVSLYGTPVANARGNMGQQLPIQVMYHDSVNLGGKTSGQTQKSGMQVSEFSNPFLKDQYNLSPVQVSLPQGPFMPNLGFQGKGMSEAGLLHGSGNGIVSGNLQMGNSQQINTTSKDFNGRKEQASWSLVQQKNTKPSQSLVPLDPLEEKILFNMEDRSLSEIASGVFGNTFDSGDFSNPFPSVQSGSWSALMQSAVAEASNSDTGIQEEFSGLTFQNMELSADNNNITNFVDGDKQQTGWVNNNSLPGSASFTSKPLPMINSSDINSSFPGFQLLSHQQRDCNYQDSTPESIQRSSKVTGHWVDRNPLQKLSMEGNRRVQSGVHFDDSCGGKMYLPSAGMFDQGQSRTGKLRTSTDLPATNLAGMSNSFQPLTSSLDLSQGRKWENVPVPLGKAGIFPQLIQQENSATVSASGALNRKNEPQMQMMVNPPATLQSDEAKLQDGNQDVTRQFNVWMDLPTRQCPLDRESPKVPLSTSPSADLLSNDVINSHKAQHLLYEAYNVPQRVGLPQDQGASAELTSDATAPTEDFPSVSQVWKPGDPISRNHSSVYQLQVTNNTDKDASKRDTKTETGPNIQLRGPATLGQKSYEQNSRLTMPMDSEMNSTSQLSSFASGDIKMLKLMMEARENQNVKALSQNLLPDVRSSGMSAFGQCQSLSQSSGNNMISSDMEHGHINLHASGLFKQFGTFRNGQMQPAYDSKNMIPGTQLSSVKSPQHLHPCAEQDHATQDARMLDTTNQNMAIITPKKRKLMKPGQLAWHEEVSHMSRRHQTISVAEQEWAQATNRLFEKAEYGIEMIEFAPPLPRSKRRLILTTQLMQQLIRPAPAFILLAEATPNYDSLLYFVARATLGDACSLTHNQENTLRSSSCDANMIETCERSHHSQCSEAAKELMEKVKKLEGDFERVEKGASMADIRFEIQDLERFAVINRFARFHSRAQVDNSGNPLPPTLPKPIPQRYVTAVPLPRNLPEGAQCLSL